MAKEELRIDVTADTSKAESDLKGLDRVASQVDLDLNVDEASKGMGSLADAAGMLPGPLGDAAGLLSGGGGIAAGAAAGATALVAIANSTADAALEAKSLQTAVGGTTEETSRLLAATGSVGLEYNDVLELIAESNNAMGKNADEAERLGVNLSGTPIERFQQLVDAVYKIPDPLERSAAASKFFGEEGSKQLPKLIGQYGDLASALEAVPEGAIMSADDVKAAQQYTAAMTELKAQLAEVATSLGKSIIPALTTATGAVNKGFSAWDKLDSGARKAEGGIRDFAAAATGMDWLRMSDGVEQAAMSTEELGTALGTGLVSAMGDVASGAKDVMAAMESQAAATDEAREANEKMRGGFFDLADAQIEAQRTAVDLTEMMKELDKADEVTRTDLERLNDAVYDQADAQVKAAGTTRETTAGAKIYNEAILKNAQSLGTRLTPEIVSYLGQLGLIPPTTLTDIMAALHRGDIDTATTLLAGLDATTATAAIEGDLNPSEFNEADRRADELDRRRVVIQIAANASAFFSTMAGVTGARTTAAATTRNSYRNGSG